MKDVFGKVGELPPTKRGGRTERIFTDDRKAAVDKSPGEWFALAEYDSSNAANALASALRARHAGTYDARIRGGVVYVTRIAPKGKRAA